MRFGFLGLRAFLVFLAFLPFVAFGLRAARFGAFGLEALRAARRLARRLVRCASVTVPPVRRGRALELGVRASRLVLVLEQTLLGGGEGRLGGGEGRRRRVLAEYVREGATAVVQGSTLFATGLCNCVSGAAAATAAASEVATLPTAGGTVELPTVDAGLLADHGWPTVRV